MKKPSNSSLEQKKKNEKTKQQNKSETEFAAGFGNKKLEGPDRPST
ncbi:MULTISPECIES: hypothetical protein [Thermoactinomyces]|nr:MULTISPECIES: hypothetical protein [Thermoactinomyces]MBH8584991.1 hypothetical protein [Thermoactinomyces sp. CICC 10520]MBI0390977.1 hypothetical protein [Thermoactinomyces sp. CICC 24226]MCF6134239.1 hypothetical protein [Thermoactinomyces vulgaris]